MATRGWNDVTAADVARINGRAAASPAKPRSKYGAVKVTLDGITFDSKAEARRYAELRLMEKAGEIRGLSVQPRFPLYVRNPDRMESEPIGAYCGDFQYVTATGDRIVEDVKGFKTPLYRWKKKHVEAQYGIQIREIR